MPDLAPRIPIAPILPPALRPFAPQLEPALNRLLFPGGLLKGLAQARKGAAGPQFAQRLMEHLGIRFSCDAGDLARIPAHGTTMVVANHPYGIVEGLILSVLLDRVRPDWKIMANSLLAGVSEMSERMILVNPFETIDAVAQNRCSGWKREDCWPSFPPAR